MAQTGAGGGGGGGVVMAGRPAAQQEEMVELQQKLMATSRELNEVQTKIALNQRNKRRAALTHDELASLPPHAPTYKSTGRMFLATPLEEVRREIEVYVAQCDDNLVNLEKKGAYLAKQLQALEASFQEMAK